MNRLNAVHFPEMRQEQPPGNFPPTASSAAAIFALTVVQRKQTTPTHTNHFQRDICPPEGFYCVCFYCQRFNVYSRRDLESSRRRGETGRAIPLRKPFMVHFTAAACNPQSIHCSRLHGVRFPNLFAGEVTRPAALAKRSDVMKPDRKKSVQPVSGQRKQMQQVEAKMAVGFSALLTGGTVNPGDH